MTDANELLARALILLNDRPNYGLRGNPEITSYKLAAEIAGHLKPPAKRIAWTCPNCGSDDVEWDAFAAWCPTTQTMTLKNDFDHASCGECCADGIHTVSVDLGDDPAGDAAILAAHKATLDDDGCPACDPDCEGGSCHDACEPSPAILAARRGLIGMEEGK